MPAPVTELIDASFDAVFERAQLLGPNGHDIVRPQIAAGGAVICDCPLDDRRDRVLWSANSAFSVAEHNLLIVPR